MRTTQGRCLLSDLRGLTGEVSLSPQRHAYYPDQRVFLLSTQRTQVRLFNIFEKTQGRKNSTAQKTQGFFRPKSNETVVTVVTWISNLRLILALLDKAKVPILREAHQKYAILEIYQALLWSIVSISRKISFIGNIAYLHTNCVFIRAAQCIDKEI